VGCGVKAGEHRGDGNRSPVRSADRASEKDVFPGKPVKNGCCVPFIAISPYVVGPERIDQNKDDIWPPARFEEEK